MWTVTNNTLGFYSNMQSAKLSILPSEVLSTLIFFGLSIVDYNEVEMLHILDTQTKKHHSE